MSTKAAALFEGSFRSAFTGLFIFVTNLIAVFCNDVLADPLSNVCVCFYY